MPTGGGETIPVAREGNRAPPPQTPQTRFVRRSEVKSFCAPGAQTASGATVWRPIEREAVRVSPTKNRQTMGKITRERERRERRELKQEKKDEKKRIAAEGGDPNAIAGEWIDGEFVEAEPAVEDDSESAPTESAADAAELPA
jgi:hypothetical protein